MLQNGIIFLRLRKKFMTIASCLCIVAGGVVWDCSSCRPDFTGQSQGKACSNPTEIVRHTLFLRKGFSLIKVKKILVKAEWRFKTGSVW